MSSRLNPSSLSVLSSTFLVLLVTAISCGGSGGGRFSDECEDWADTIIDCLELDFNDDDAIKITKDECIDDLKESVILDDEDCADAQLTAYECLNDETCDHVFEFTALRWRDVFLANGNPGPPLDFCDTEIRAAIAACPVSIRLEGDPTRL